MILSFVLLFPAYTRKSCPSITCRAGYYAVHLLRKYTTMLGFFLLLFPAHTRKSCRLRASRTSCVLIFSYVNLSPYLITFGDGLKLHHASALRDRIRSEENFYNLLCRLLRRTFASQIYDNSHYKKALDRIYFCQGRINFPRCHLASRQYACTFRILTYPRQLTYASRHRILRCFLSLCPPWSI